MAMTAAQRTLRARLAAYTLHATHDPVETTSKARTAFLARFEREVDPDGKLSPEERERRAMCARSAYFTRLQLQSSVQRGDRKSRKSRRRTKKNRQSLD